MDWLREVGTTILRWNIWNRLRPNRRESIALVILLVPVVAGGVLALIDRPSSASLDVEQASSDKHLTIVAGDGNGSGRLRAQSSLVHLGAFSSGRGESTHPQGRLVELGLPVSPSACLRLLSRLDGTCDRGGTPPSRAARSLTIEWPSGGRVVVAAQESRRLWLRPTPISGATTGYRALNLGIDAPITEVSVECTERATFYLVFSGRVEPLRCEYGSARYRVRLAYQPRLAPKIFATGLGWWRFGGSGTEAEAWVDRGLLTVRNDDRDLGATETKVAITADGSREVSAVLDNLDTLDQVSYTVETRSASSIDVDGSQALPSRLSQYENIWLLIVGIVGGVLLAIYLERVPRNEP